MHARHVDNVVMIKVSLAPVKIVGSVGENPCRVGRDGVFEGNLKRDSSSQKAGRNPAVATDCGGERTATTLGKYQRCGALVCAVSAQTAGHTSAYLGVARFYGRVSQS